MACKKKSGWSEKKDAARASDRKAARELRERFSAEIDSFPVRRVPMGVSGDIVLIEPPRMTRAKASRVARRQAISNARRKSAEKTV